MKQALVFLCLVLFSITSVAVDAATDIGLLDGSRIKGRVMTATASEVTVMSDLGVFRIPLEKLTPESRQAITQETKPDVEALLRRIAELEAKVSQLQQENETLRKGVVSNSSPMIRPSGASSFAPSGGSTPTATGGSFSISSTGKRHNNGCRYFGSGRACGSTDGIACKICGG